MLVHPNLVCDLAIGQSTPPTQRVRGNLFYRGLVLERPVFVGETLRTRTEVVGLKQNRRRADGSAAGLVALRIRTTDAHGEPLLDFWRCPMIPLREPETDTGHADDFDDIPKAVDPAAVEGAVPESWKLEPLRAATPGPHHEDLAAGTAFAVEAGETVTGATELARLTLNVAIAHTDATGSSHGRRLVYGGHTIAVAAAHATRAIPAIATIVAWQGCDHLGAGLRGRRAAHGAEGGGNGAACGRRWAGCSEGAGDRCPRGGGRARAGTRLELPGARGLGEGDGNARHSGRHARSGGLRLRGGAARRNGDGAARRRRDPLRPDRRRARPRPLAGDGRGQEPLLGRPQQGQALDPGGPALRRGPRAGVRARDRPRPGRRPVPDQFPRARLPRLRSAVGPPAATS